jgi:sugar phosphate isomerase/epimerase
MNRRNFLQQASAGGMALSFPNWTEGGFPNMTFPSIAKDNRMGIVVHSYGSRWNSKADSKTYPAFTNAIDLLEHCHQLGAGGIQVVVSGWTTDFAKKVRERREKLGLYLEGSIGLPKKDSDVAAFEQEVINAREAGAQVLRTVCSAGRRYEVYHSPEDYQNFVKSATAMLQRSEPILRKHKVKLAIENHKDWLAKDLVSFLKQVNSEWVGATLDFGNNIALLEDPMEVAQTLAPYIFSTHIKDMAVEEYPDGFLLSEVPLGSGILDLPRMIEVCRQKNPAVTFSLEMITRDPLEIPCLKDDYWATFGSVPGLTLARTLRMVREHKPKGGLPRITQLDAEHKLATEEQNIVACLDYGKAKLGLA